MKHPVPYVDHDVRRSRHVASEVPRRRVVMIRRIEEPVVLRLSEPHVTFVLPSTKTHVP